MKKSMVVRVAVAIGVASLVAGPMVTTAASAASPAKVKHHHHKGGGKAKSGIKFKALGDLEMTSTTQAVAFALAGSGWGDGQTIEVSSADLLNGCPTYTGFFPSSVLPTANIGNPGTLSADFNGDFVLSVVAIGCSPGTYQALAQQLSSPSSTALTNFVITAPTPPAPSTPTVSLSPASETETGTEQGIAGTVILSGFGGSTNYTLQLTGIEDACDANGGATGVGSVGSSGAVGTLGGGILGLTDFAGYDIAVFNAVGCNPGTYTIAVTDQPTGPEIDASFTILP